MITGDSHSVQTTNTVCPIKSQLIHVRDVEPSLGEEFLDVPIAQREAQVEPDRMLDDHRRKAVAAVGDFSHRTSLPVVSLPSHPVILTKQPEALRRVGLNRRRRRVMRVPEWIMTTVLITVRPIQAGVTGELRGGDQRVRACCSGPQTVGRKGLSEAGFEPSGNSRVGSTSHALIG